MIMGRKYYGQRHFRADQENQSCSDLSCAENWIRKKLQLLNEGFGLDFLAVEYIKCTRQQSFLIFWVCGQPTLEPKRR